MVPISDLSIKGRRRWSLWNTKIVVPIYLPDCFAFTEVECFITSDRILLLLPSLLATVVQFGHYIALTGTADRRLDSSDPNHSVLQKIVLPLSPLHSPSQHNSVTLVC